MAPPLPWRAMADVDPEGTYVVTMTRLPLRRHTRIPAVMRATWKIVRELARSDGLVGYSLKADLIRKTFWTVSAWESTAGLHAFVRSDVHVRAMTDVGPHMAEPRIETTSMPGTDLPPSWSRVRDRLTGSSRASV
jgi:hypothetical protein